MTNMQCKNNKTTYYAFLCLKYTLTNKTFTLDDLNNYLEQRENIFLQNETFLKYIRTFKKLGLKFHRLNNKTYKLVELPFDINFNIQDKNILQKCFLLYNTYLNTGTISNDKNFLSNINLFLKRTTDNEKTYTQTSKNIINIENNEKLFLIKKYCSDAQRLEITYLEQQNVIINTIEPESIITLGDGVYLKAYNVTLKVLNMFDINTIIRIEQTPIKNKFSFKKNQVVLKLTSRLAKTYVLKEGEEIINKSSKALTIKTFYYDKILFFKNILRYMDTCEIIAPIPLAKDFKLFLNDLIMLYNCKN